MASPSSTLLNCLVSSRLSKETPPGDGQSMRAWLNPMPLASVAFHKDYEMRLILLKDTKNETDKEGSFKRFSSPGKCVTFAMNLQGCVSSL